MADESQESGERSGAESAPPEPGDEAELPSVKQTAVGRNVIQQVGNGVARIFDIDVNVSVLGAMVIAVPVLVLAAVIGLIATRTDPLEPLEGPGTKIAVAAFGGDAAAGQQVGSFVASSLTSELDDELFTVAGPNRVRDRPRSPEEAMRTATKLDADVVVYGAVEPARGGEGSVIVNLRLAVASQGVRENLPIVLDELFGRPFAVVPEDLSGTDPAAVGDTRALVPFIGGVGALSADNAARARQQFQLSADLAGSDDLRSVNRTMLGFSELTAATLSLDLTLLDAAEEHFRAALELDDDADLARVGQLNVAYLEAIDPQTFAVTDVDAMRDVIRRFDALAAATDDPFARASAIAQAAQGEIAIGTAGDVVDARTRLESLLTELPDLEQRPWGLFESYIQRQLGLVEFLDGDLDAAISRYEDAAVRATPYWSAFSLAAVGQIEVSRGQPCQAVAWFADAAAGVAGRFPDEADDYVARATEAEAACGSS